MADISAEKVKELREKSGAGMMDCKRALSAVNGDLDQAIDFLRKEGVLKAAKKAGRATLEGLVAPAIASDRHRAALVEINCETDFVARTDQFQDFLRSLAEHIMKEKPADLPSLLTGKFANSTVQETLAHIISKLGENMEIRRFKVVEAGPGEVLSTYLHAGSKIGVIVKVKGEGVEEGIVKDIAMHVAAMAPQYVNRQDVSEAALHREKEVLKAALETSGELKGKPENIVEKIMIGKLNRFYSESCLAEQPFIKDTSGKKTVGDTLKEKSPGAQIAEVVRFQVGEEIR